MESKLKEGTVFPILRSFNRVLVVASLIVSIHHSKVGLSPAGDDGCLNYLQ